MAWARHRLLCLALANANHSGELALAQARHEELVALQPRVQGRWEELPALMSAQLHWAVSCVDRLELDEAARLARRVEGFYKGMSALLREVEGGELVSQSPRANLRGQALGLLLWVRRHRCAEALARGEDPAAHLEEGRALGAEALALFEAPEDLARVDQQLAHLEGLAGRFDEAWELLARRSRDPNDDDPCPPRDEVAYGLARLSADALPFPLSHALRLRAMERLAAPSSCVASAPLDDFLGTAPLPLLRGEQESYPAHSSLRALAQLAALAGDPLRALSALRALHALLTRGGGGDALKLLYLCACAEAVAALTLRGGEREALAQARALLKQELLLQPPALAPLPALSAYLGELLGAAHALERAAATREDPAAARALLLTAARYAL